MFEFSDKDFKAAIMKTHQQATTHHLEQMEGEGRETSSQPRNETGVIKRNPNESYRIEKHNTETENFFFKETCWKHSIGECR